jgi:predicted negative regulator of RcsB-dependent stress response
VLLLYDVPAQPLDAARQALADAPNDPVAHLALARAQWQAGDPSAAQQTISSGQSTASDRLRYLFTAAVLADETGSVNAAAILYVQALALSQTDQQRYAVVRAAAGEYLYDLSRDPTGFNLAEIQRLNDGAESPIVSIMLARLLLTQNRPLVAQTRLRTLPSAARALPEAVLVRGEILAALNQPDEADAEWSRIATMDDVPEWVRQRAASLLQST